MAAQKKTEKVNPLASPPADARALEESRLLELPYALRRELEEIQKNTGRPIDFCLPVSELEKICNSANRPADAWRNRWTE